MKEQGAERKRKNRRNSGFTLVEIMVVVVIIGLLATLVTINAPAIIHRQRVKAARNNIARLMNAVDTYYVEVGKYPQALKDLVASGKKDIKIIKKVPKDPWGNEFVYRLPGLHNEDYSITSYGADGMEGGDGKNVDINSWDLDEEEEL